jgi:pSer/pThr/pTyr-binding forkhead associated (FHA) protein
MSETRVSSEGDGLPVQGPHWRVRRDAPAAPDFTPLRLVLQPSGVTIELTHSNMLVGRHTDSDVRLPLPDVSRRHCRFLYADGRWSIHDLQSLNGTFVNEEAVQSAQLHQGDLVRIGGFTFRIDLGQAEQPGDTPQDDSLAQRIFKFRPRSELFGGPRRRAS